MDILHALIGGIFVALEPINLGLAIIGVVVGLFVGAMPGLGSVNGVAILLPFTFVIQNFTGGATSPMIFLAAIYYGAMYGGAISSITLGIPGASTAVATTFDGRPMALTGRAHIALVTAALASFAGGTISNVLFTGFAPMLASVALSFGNPEIFALMLLAFATFVGLGGDDIPKTIFSICIGLVLATVGFDIISGEPRLIFFDITGFSHGIRFLVLAIGVYGIGEMLWTINASRDGSSMSQVDVSAKNILQAIKQFPTAWRGTMIGSAMGFFVGILPAAGATPGSLMSYGVTKLTSKDPDSFGKGSMDGVAAPEAANNSASTGAMLPMMTLGIPGSPTTAVLLAGMDIWAHLGLFGSYWQPRTPFRPHLGAATRPVAFYQPAGFCLAFDWVLLHIEHYCCAGEFGVHPDFSLDVADAFYNSGASYFCAVSGWDICGVFGSF